MRGEPLPRWHLRGDGGGWASFMTEQFWRNLPGPGIAIITFLVVGFVIIYLLGSRSFCRYVCPYGAVFALADRLSPAKIVARGDCSQCGLCTAACPSHIRVHEELTVFGRVVNPACIKDFNCIAACPDESIGYGLAKPAGFTSLIPHANVKYPKYDFTRAEDVMMAALFVFAFLTFRGLYGIVPFLLSLALSACIAYASILFIRMYSHANVRLNNLQLKRNCRITGAGHVFVVLMLAMIAFTTHSAVVHARSEIGRRLFATLMAQEKPDPSQVDASIAHLAAADFWGLLTPPDIHAMLAHLYIQRGERFAEQGDYNGAADQYAAAIQHHPELPEAHYNLGVLLAAGGRIDDAIHHFERASAIAPDDADVRNNIGFALMQGGRLREAEDHLRHAIVLRPDLAQAHFNLGRLLPCDATRG